MNTRLIAGLILVLLGIIVLVSPQFLAIIVGLALVVGGLWLALQNAPTGGNI